MSNAGELAARFIREEFDFDVDLEAVAEFVGDNADGDETDKELEWLTHTVAKYVKADIDIMIMRWEDENE